MIDITLIIADLLMTAFLLFIHTQMFELRQKNLTYKLIVYISCAIIFASYAIVGYGTHISPGMASLVCVTIPSFIVFLILSKYRDERFVVTFCFLHSIALIVSFLVRYISVLGGEVVSVVAVVVLVLVLVGLYFLFRPYFKVYREVLGSVRHGWLSLTVAMLMSYFSLIFLSQYPRPIMQRVDDFHGYAVFTLTILAFFFVFITTINERNKLVEMNEKLIKEQSWHKMAYVDALTAIKNRMAYMEYINELERNLNPDSTVCAVMIDIDSFKNVNDRLGHHAGDALLRTVADNLRTVFATSSYEIFRIGGDEFAIVALGISEEGVKERVAQLHELMNDQMAVTTVSVGYSFVRPEQNNSVESAFIRADKEMYEVKRVKHQNKYEIVEEM